jgi:hypothetical protein
MPRDVNRAGMKDMRRQPILKDWRPAVDRRSYPRALMGRARRWAAAVAVLAVAVGGCTVHPEGIRLRSGNNEPGSILHDNKILIDLRHKPTRQDFGFQAGKNSRSYQRGAGKPQIATTVLLPTGPLNTPAFGVNAASDGTGGADDTVAHNPKDFDIERTFPDAAAAARTLTDNAGVLGLHQADIDQLMPRLGQNRRTRTVQQGVLDGLVRDWLAVEVELNSDEDGTVQVDYHFTIDQYHNQAVDKVLHHGVFAIDLVRPPSRAALAFLDTYNDARVEPAPNTTLTVRIALPGGTVRRRVDSVDSTTTAGGVADNQGTGEPRSTIVSLASGSIADARRTLDADAAVLGLQPSALKAVFSGNTGHVKTTLPGRKTPVCDISVHIDANLGEPGAFAAAIAYTFTYHHDRAKKAP